MFLDRQSKNIIFYSESFFYKNFYIDLLKALKKNERIIFVSSDIKEVKFLRKKKIQSYFIKNNIIKTLFFSTLNSNYLILTMTDIGLNYPKSIFSCKYIYYFHSLASTHKIYTKTAFDNYDIIFVNGSYQKNEIEYFEKQYSLKKKKLIKTGYFFLNYLKKKLNKKKCNNSILYAPSWNYSKRNLFNDYSEEIITKLIELQYKVILRPHPELVKRYPKKILNIKKKFGHNKNFIYDVSPDNLKSMQKSIYCITDNSTITMEFALALSRHVIYIDYVDKIHNNSFSKKKFETLENKFKKNFGLTIHVKDFLSLTKLDKNLFANYLNYKKRLDNFEKKYFYNSKDSINKAVDFFQNLSNK